VSLAARSIFAALLAFLALASPALASTYFEDDGGRLVPHDDPYLPPPEGPEAAVDGSEQACPAPFAAPRPKPAVRAAGGPTVKQVIASARKRGEITPEAANGYLKTYSDARNTRNRIGSYKNEQAAVIRTLEALASRNQLTPSRMPALFMQLSRNTQFWGGNPTFPPRTDVLPEPCSAPPGRAGSRIKFPGSKLVYQYYPGQGLQFQPLANFGTANGMVTACATKPAKCDKAGLKQLLDELVAMHSTRGGFVTWEYWFTFGGGTPPWTSGLSQGTAIQALGRAAQPDVLNDPSYQRLAKQALGAFEKPPPVGVRVSADGGNHYLIYSFAPGQRVLNAFLQAITGLYDFSKLTGDKEARSLFVKGDRAARREIPRFDTGSWSLYSVGGEESSLGYHRLVTTFLGNLCNRLKVGAYCKYRKRFLAYLHTKPRIAYTGRARVSVGELLAMSYRLDKVSCVTADITNAQGANLYHARVKVTRGARGFSWKPSTAGRFTLKLNALDLNKNSTTITERLTVKAKK
jgi:hypothetical protein